MLRAKQKRLLGALSYARGLKKAKWKKQGGKCACKDCPMGGTLEEGLRWIRTHISDFETGFEAMDLFLMFYTQFEHADPLIKLFNLGSSQDVPHTLIDAEVKKCSIYCVFCARLNTMESGHGQGLHIVPWEDPAEGDEDGDEDGDGFGGCLKLVLMML